MMMFLQMRWVVEDRMSFDEVWRRQVEEDRVVRESIGLVGIWKVAGQKRVLAIVEVDDADQLDRVVMSKLPLREYLEFETVWPLRSFANFIEDCRTGFLDSSVE
ncbi:MAG: muconolactone Delta-isomerase family protein [Mycobacterium sp.]